MEWHQTVTSFYVNFGLYLRSKGHLKRRATLLLDWVLGVSPVMILVSSVWWIAMKEEGKWIESICELQSLNINYML